MRRAAERLLHDKGPIAAPSSLVHEGFEELFRKGKLGEVPNRAFFYFVARRKMHDIMVKRFRHLQPDMQSWDDQVEQCIDECAAELEHEMEALYDALRRFRLSRVPNKRRRHELITRVYLERMTIKAAAKRVGVSYSQARDDIRLGLAELAVELKRRESWG